MLLPQIYITISGIDGTKAIDFSYCVEVEIDKSWKSLTDTCVIKLPRKLKLNNKNLIDFIKAGQSVVVKMGFNGKINTEFEGYIARTEPNSPAVLHCECEMWKLKQGNFKLSYRNVTLKALLADIAPNYETNTLDAELGPFRVNNASAAKVLDEIRKNYGFSSWFVGKVLHVGLPYTLGKKTRHDYSFQRNVLEQDKLTYKSKNEAKIQVKAISIMPDNSRIEETVGDEGGELHTLHFYKLDKATLKARALENIDKLKYDGYRGTLKTVGFPYCLHGDTAEVADELYIERTGRYFIDATKTEFGMSGFHRTVTLGGKAI